MKKIILSLVAVMAFAFVSNAQTEQGSKLIEINTGFGGAAAGGGQNVGNTGFQFFSVEDGGNIWNLGAEGGYFVADDFAAKVGLGIGGGDDAATVFSFKLGGEYYINSVIPVELSLTGASIEDLDENPLHLGGQVGYAWFIGDNISIKPGVRYNLSLNDDFYRDFFNGNIGFTWFLN